MMIRDDHRLPEDAVDKVPELVSIISRDPAVVALYAFGSLARGSLKPLSDLDFAVLLPNSLPPLQRSEKLLDLIGVFNRVLGTDEVDLVLLNSAPPRFGYSVLRTGKLLYAGDNSLIADFFDRTTKRHLDFKFAREHFDRAFLDGIGYRG